MEAQYIVTAEMRRLTNRLFDLLEARGVRQIRVEDPQYWTVFPEAREPVEMPSPVMGDVVDDLIDLRAEAGGTTESLVVWHAFNHLADVMKLIARADINGDLVGGTRL